MFTEYIFHDKRNEVAVRDLKATLYDVFVSEEKKLEGIADKISSETDDEKSEKTNHEFRNSLYMAELYKYFISGKLNDKVVDVNYGYSDWFEDKLKPILDSLYYTKGTSIRFPKPKPTDLRPIGELLMNEKP